MPNASSFRYGDIYKNQGRNTAETANQATATQEASNPGPSMLGSGNSNAPMQGSPAVILACIILIFFALRFFAARSGDGEDYVGIAPSFYNIMVITLAALLGGTLLKVVAVRTLPESNAMRKLFVQGL